MNLTEYLDKDQIIADLASATKTEVLAELISPLTAAYPFLDKQKIFEVLLFRENLGTTGIGDAVAIPHGKLDNLDKVLLVVGRSLQGVDFASLDHKLVNIFFLVLAPEKSAGKHLKILAYISRLLQDQSFKESFMSASDRDDLWNLITRR
ncbi:PTS sugar transporter subunit IIA [Desulfonatronovibrio magnus]|uniref:PTS sugar transporter subunit IIA n=1 Tax=Desulfonatronovibrio magnus TaxID=698827 RepID=UPI0005EB7D8E|nr:PTS sugar transporter subunit IIA [Desulfonatronovibrio magnus]